MTLGGFDGTATIDGCATSSAAADTETCSVCLLSADELAILHELQGNTRTVQRHRDIITEGRSYDSLFHSN